MRYKHNSSVQALAFNPVTAQLISGSIEELGVWSPHEKSVTKNKIDSRVCCLSWTSDGQTLAIGKYDGSISIRNNSMEEISLIQRTQPIWSIAWGRSKHSKAEFLVAACWDQTLSFYVANGQKIREDCKLDYDCNCVRFMHDDYILVVCKNISFFVT